MPSLKRVLPALAVAALLPGCGGGDGPGARTSTGPDGGPRPAAGARTGTAELRARLAATLVDRAHLAGLRANAALAEGLDGEAFRAATRALDAADRELAEIVGSVGGDDAAEDVLGLLRARAGATIDYAKGRAGQDPTAEAAAEQALEAQRDELAGALAAAGRRVTPEALERRLRLLERGVLAAVDDAAAGDLGFYVAQRRTATRAPALAAPLSAGLAARAGRRLDGEAGSPAAELRAQLAALLADHAHLVGTAVAAAAGAGTASEAARSAQGAVDRSSRALAKVVADAYDERTGARFLTLWRAHVEMFGDYARAQLGGRRQAAQEALLDLDGWRAELGAFLADANPQLTTGAVAQQLEPHVASMTAAIRAAVKRSPETFARLRTASTQLRGTAALLADAIARQQPRRFPAG